MLKEINIRTIKRIEFVDITREVEDIIRQAGVQEGICVIYSPHTTAGLTINENADPSVKEDIQNHLSKLVPPHAGYKHLEGNADSHIKTSIIGPSLSLIITGGKLLLGTWQGIFFAEFDGPRNRHVYVKILAEK